MIAVPASSVRIGWALMLLAAVLLPACGGMTGPAPPPTAPSTAPAATVPTPTTTGTVTVFAAASLAEAFTDLGQSFAATSPGAKVALTFAGSPALRTQLREGARADIFAAADEPTMRGAQQDGTIGGDPRVFVQNKLVVIVAQPQAGDISHLRDLARPGLKLVLAQEAVPVGAYARQSLAKMSADPTFGADFAQRVQANVVSHEANVRQIVAKVQLGEADAGIVYASDVTPAVRGQVAVLAIPDAANVIARYPIATVAGAQNPAGARAFIDYVLSPAGQATLAHWGFIPVGPTGATASAPATGQ